MLPHPPTPDFLVGPRADLPNKPTTTTTTTTTMTNTSIIDTTTNIVPIPSQTQPPGKKRPATNDSNKQPAKRRSKKKKQQQQRQDQQQQQSHHQHALEQTQREPIPQYDAFHRPTPTRTIKKIHIYDFDNTLFRSPAPNPALFQDGTLGMLTSGEHLANGGWWKEPLVFRNLGEGWPKESERAWEGFWNEDIVELLRMSIDDDEALTIVMTGRRKTLFAHLIKEMLQSKNLFDDIDGLMLRQGEFDTTIEYKTEVLVDILNYFTDATEVVLYDDRKSQLNGFEKCLNEYTEAVRPSLISIMVPVFTDPVHMDPKAERKLVEEMIETHNNLLQSSKKAQNCKLAKSALRKSNLYTSYLVDYDSRANIIKHLLAHFPDIFTEEISNTFRFHADHIPIVRGLMSRSLQKEANGKPTEIEWRSTHIGTSDTHIAVLVEPVDEGSVVRTLQTPALLPIAAKGKNSARPTEEYTQITEWRVLKEEEQVQFNSRITSIINFKIIHEGGSTKGMNKKKTLDTDQQAELP